MRLFVAIDIDAAARQALVDIQKKIVRLVSTKSDLRLVQPEQIHLTLAFIGEVDDVKAAAIVEAMGRPISVERYTLIVGGLGIFPSRGAPRVLWVGSTAGARETIAVRQVVADRVAAVGVTLEERAFHAHFTLARWRVAAGADRRAVAAAADTGELARVPVDAVTLYRSRLAPTGSQYTILAKAPLGGS